MIYLVPFIVENKRVASPPRGFDTYDIPLLGAIDRGLSVAKFSVRQILFASDDAKTRRKAAEFTARSHYRGRSRIRFSDGDEVIANLVNH